MKKMLLTKWNNLTKLILIPGLQQEKWENYPRKYSRTTACPKPLEKLFFKQNLEIRLFPSNHRSWTEKFGLPCRVKPKITIGTSERSYIDFRQSLDLSTTPYEWSTLPNRMKKQENNSKLGSFWNKQSLMPEPWHWTHFRLLMSCAKNRHSKQPYRLHITNLRPKKK